MHAQLCQTLCDPMDYNTSGFPVLHYLLEFAQTYVHWLKDASQHLILCHPLLLLLSIFPSIRVFSNELAICIRWPASASVLPMNIQGWFLLGLTGLISLQSKGLSKVWVGFHFLLQRIFSTQRWNPCFLHWHSLLLSHQGSPYDF